MLLAGFAGLACYVMKPEVAGFLYDDGMYLMAAKALAAGEGYRLSGVVGAPLFYKYPPLYPLILALGWLFNPHFPQNMVWFKCLNILFSTLTLGLWGYYFQKIRRFSTGISLLLVAIVATNWRFLEVSTELMSEPLWMLLTVITLILCHRFHAKNQPLSLFQTGILIGLSVAAFYTRTMALPLMAGVGLWLWINRQRKQALFYAVGSFTLSLPWLQWSGARKDTTYGVGDFLVRSFQETYFQSFRMDLNHEYTLIELLSKGASELLGNLSVQFFPLLERFFLSKPTLFSESIILALSMLLTLGLGHYAYQQLQKRQYSPEGLYVAFYLVILPFWSFHSVYPRFIMPLMPLLISFLVSMAPDSPRFKTAVAFALPTLLVGMLGLNALHLAPYLQKATPNELTVQPQLNLWAEYQQAFQFIKTHTPAHSRIYIKNMDENYFYALHTHRPVFDFFIFLPQKRLLKACPNPNRICLEQLQQQNTQATGQVLNYQGAHYIVDSPVRVLKNQYNNWFPVPSTKQLNPLFSSPAPKRLERVFQTQAGLISIYQYVPAPNFSQPLLLHEKDQ